MDKKITPKGLAYKCDILRERGSRINVRLTRKYVIIEELLFLSSIAVVVEEKMGQSMNYSRCC